MELKEIDGQPIETDPPLEILEAVAASDAASVNPENASSGEKTQEAKGAGEPYVPTPLEKAVKDIKAAYVAAKRRYRVTPARIEKLQAALNAYLGTNNFHNFTVEKKFKDPSSKRHIHSFALNPDPIPIRDTEWLSLKVHGQSFMMHQIRKMVGMAVMLTRCGAPVDIISESYGPRRIQHSQGSGLGLMLEAPCVQCIQQEDRRRPVRQGADRLRPYEEKIQEFKDREIYRRMFEAEGEGKCVS